MADKEDKNNAGKRNHTDEVILNLIEGMSPVAANRVIDAYYQFPIVIRDALSDFYKAMGGISEEGGIERVKKALAALNEICDGNGEYADICKAAKEEANQEIAEMYANGGMSV